MKMKWNGVIQRKLALLDRQLGELEPRLAGVSRDAFVGDWGLRAMCERTLQVCVEIMIDVAERIISLSGGGPVATAAEAIERLHKLAVLRDVEPYRSMVRMRNLIVHAYEEVDPDLLFEIVTQKLGDFRRFRDEIDLANKE